MLLIDAVLEEGEFGARRGRDLAPPGQHGIPRQVLQHQPDDQEDQLQLARGDAELAIPLGCVEERVLERDPVALGQVVADDELIVGMDVDESLGLAVIAVEVQDPGQRRWSPCELEVEAMHDFREAVLVSASDEEVEVVLGRSRAIEERVALPMAVADPVGLQRGAQVAHERDRRLAGDRLRVVNAHDSSTSRRERSPPAPAPPGFPDPPTTVANPARRPAPQAA